VTFIDWTSSVTLCTPFTYTATLSDGSALNSAFINFTPATRSFSIITSNPIYIGTYSIKITGTLSSGGASSTLNFSLDIKNPCQLALISPSSVAANTYYTGTPAINFNIPVFT
jgi:hypothetical protein